jgi:hypothetical protein
LRVMDLDLGNPSLCRRALLLETLALRDRPGKLGARGRSWSLPAGTESAADFADSPQRAVGTPIRGGAHY